MQNNFSPRSVTCFAAIDLYSYLQQMNIKTNALRKTAGRYHFENVYSIRIRFSTVVVHYSNSGKWASAFDVEAVPA
jgi:hypothetical protein